MTLSQSFVTISKQLGCSEMYKTSYNEWPIMPDELTAELKICL